MISDKQRREVAERLRGLAANRHYVDEFIAADTVGFWRGEAVEGFDSDSLLEVADLIDCPTCEMEGHPGARYGRCSRCGAFVRRDAVTDCTGVIPAKFCPNCRAEVFAGDFGDDGETEGGR